MATTEATTAVAAEETGRPTTAAPVALDPPLGAVAANLGANVTLFRSLLRPGVHFPSNSFGNGDAADGDAVVTADPLRFLKHPRWRGGPMASQRHGASPTPMMMTGGSSTTQQPAAGVVVAVLLPDPHDAESTFYRTRRAALCERGYGLAPLPAADSTATTNDAADAAAAVAEPAGAASTLATPARPSGRALPTGSPASAAGSPTAVAPSGPPRPRTLLEDDRSSVVVAIDHASGTGAKKFNTLPRRDVLEFVSRSSMPNLYVAVDPELPLDPFFDIDLNIAPEKVWELAGHLALRTGEADADAALAPNHGAWTASQCAILSKCFNECSKFVVLHDALNMVILPALVNFFRSPVDHLAVFDASVCSIANDGAMPVHTVSNPPQFKVSFHIHARMRNGLCFRNVAEHKRFALIELPRAAEAAAAAVPSPMRQRQHRSEQADAAQAATRAAMAREFSVAIDTAVYTSWRMFRLPWCSKRQAAGRLGPALLPVLPDALPTSDLGPVPQLRETLQRMTVVPAERSVAAMPEGSSVSALVTGLPHPVRMLLGGAADTDEAGHRRAFVLWRVMELSLITRSPADVALAGSRLTFKALGTAVIDGSSSAAQTTPGRPQAASAEQQAAEMAHGASASPAAGAGVAPLRVGRRVAVVDDRANVLLRLFQMLDPHYDPARAGPLAETTAAAGAAGFGGPVHRLTRVESEDNGQIRMYYAMQKQSRWCLRQSRAHKKTHGQLYVTFGSIKYRCYSNDCHDACVVIDWTPETLPLREQLFPPLPVEELRRRYPHRHFESADDTGSDFDGASVDGDAGTAAATNNHAASGAVAAQEELQLSRQLDEALSRQD